MDDLLGGFLNWLVFFPSPSACVRGMREKRFLISPFRRRRRLSFRRPPSSAVLGSSLHNFWTAWHVQNVKLSKTVRPEERFLPASCLRVFLC